MKRLILPLSLLLSLSLSILTSASDSNVSISTESFSPSAGQSVSITFRVTMPGKVSVEILDLNQRVIRTLASEEVKPGFFKYEWRGEDSKGDIVKNGCYFPRIRYESAGNSEVNTSETQLKRVEIKPDYYDQLTGVLSYRLPQSSLVTIKAEAAWLNKATGQLERKVRKVIVENAPRTAGKVIDYFNGYDDKGEYIPKSNYFITIDAQLLPANTIIVYGGTDSKGIAL